MDAQKIIAAALPVFAEFLQCGRLCHLSEILLTEQEFNQDTLLPLTLSAQAHEELKSSLLKDIFPFGEKTFLKSRRNEDLPHPFSPIKAEESEKSAFSSLMPLNPFTKILLRNI